MDQELRPHRRSSPLLTGGIDQPIAVDAALGSIGITAVGDHPAIGRWFTAEGCPPQLQTPAPACSCSLSQLRSAAKSSTTPKGCGCCQARHWPLGPNKFQPVQRAPTTWAGKPNS